MDHSSGEGHVFGAGSHKLGGHSALVSGALLFSVRSNATRHPRRESHTTSGYQLCSVEGSLRIKLLELGSLLILHIGTIFLELGLVFLAIEFSSIINIVALCPL